MFNQDDVDKIMRSIGLFADSYQITSPYGRDVALDRIREAINDLYDGEAEEYIRNLQEGEC